MASLVLGTVQLGMPYGVANKIGKPDEKTAIEIVRAAWEGGICEFDTAREYGESERVLGVAFCALGIADKVRVVSKIAKDVDVDDGDAVAKAVTESIARLGVPRLYGLLMHKEELIERAGGLRTAVEQGLVEYVGVSVYSSERALQAIETNGISIVQIPSNILDRRFEQACVFERAEEAGKKVYVRSVFLQGLLLMDPNTLPSYIRFAKEVVGRTEELARALQMTRQSLALQYVKTAFPEARVIVGAETPEQARENIAAWNRETPRDLVARVREVFNNIDERVVDPRQWPRA